MKEIQTHIYNGNKNARNGDRVLRRLHQIKKTIKRPREIISQTGYANSVKTAEDRRYVYVSSVSGQNIEAIILVINTRRNNFLHQGR